MIEKTLTKWREGNAVPGVAVGMYSNGASTLWTDGVTDIESNAKMTNDTLFRIYSVSKLVTAVAVLSLVRAEKVDLDAPMTAYVDGLTRRNSEPVRLTVRQALGHSSGLWPDSLTWLRVGRNPQDMATEIRRDYARAYNFAAAGQFFSYSNAAFNLNGLLIEQTTEQPFSAALRTLLFDPIGMPTSTHDPAMAMTYPSAQHHEIDDQGRLRVVHRAMVGSKWFPGSQCYSSVRELTAFATWLLNDLLTQKNAALRIDQAQSELGLDVGTRYGLGCYMSSNAYGEPTVGHEGFYEGMWAKIVVDPNQDRCLVWLDNRGDELRDTRYEVMEELMPGLLPAPTHTTRTSSGGTPPMPPLGTYRRLGGPNLTITDSDAGLTLQLADSTRTVRHFDRGVWSTPATKLDATTPWRPHAGSRSICLGVPVDTTDPSVIHLNGLPYVLASN